MDRRNFLGLGAAGAALWAEPLHPDAGQLELEQSTPGASPTIVLNHLGFRPDGQKKLPVRTAHTNKNMNFAMREVGSVLKPFQITRPLSWSGTGDHPCYTADFSDVTRVGMYQIAVNGERSVPFFIREDVWRRTLPKAFGYHKYQRCGIAVPNVHPVCHLDDARRRDNGEHVDLGGGGWHDAGDLRKWMDVTMLNAVGMLWIVRNLGNDWDAAGSGPQPIYEEARWGNRYFLKMQDKDGLVFADVAGGVNGDNSDNHWTDNIVGTADDRYVNVSKPELVQGIFTTLQAMMARTFETIDAPYAKTCLDAALRCAKAAKRDGATQETSWWVLASLELWRATHDNKYRQAAEEAAEQLGALQNAKFSHEQRKLRGYWWKSPADHDPYCQAVYSALPAIALARILLEMPDAPDAAQWKERLKMYLDEYVFPLAGRSPYATVPYGIFYNSPTAETYRPLSGDITYRYFMPTRERYWWLGVNSHLECHAVSLALAAQIFERRDCRDLAYRQLEWVMGANPFGACMMTGEGMRNPYPHSRYVGLIPGGIMNGIAGNPNDQPILDQKFRMDWRTAEYWSPQNAYYEWAVSTLAMPS